MYKTKEEILMFEKAVEIQKNRVYEIGDRIYMPIFCKRIFGKLQSVSVHKEIGCVLDAEQVNNVNNEDLLHFHCVWLPYQHQLENMVRGELTSWKFVQKFWNWLWTRESAKFIDGLSMEQLLLAFVMNKKYNKQWNGKQWMIRKKH